MGAPEVYVMFRWLALELLVSSGTVRESWLST